MNSNNIQKQLDSLTNDLCRLNKHNSAQKIIYLISDPTSLSQEYFTPISPHFIKQAFNKVISSYCDTNLVKYRDPSCPDTLFTLILASIWNGRASIYEHSDIFEDFFCGLISGFLILQKKTLFSEKLKKNLTFRENFNEKFTFKQNSEENLFNFYLNILPSFLAHNPKKAEYSSLVSSQISILTDALILKFSPSLLRLITLLAAAAPSSESYDSAFAVFTSFAAPPSPHDSILAMELCAWATRDLIDEPTCSLANEIIAALCATFSDPRLSRYCQAEIAEGLTELTDKCQLYSSANNSFIANNLIAAMIRIKDDNTNKLSLLIPVLAELPSDSLPLAALKRLWLNISLNSLFEEKSAETELQSAISKLSLKSQPLLVQNITSVNQLILGSSSSDVSVQALSTLSAALATPQLYDTHLLAESFSRSIQSKLPFSMNPLPKSTFNQFSNTDLSKALQKLSLVSASHLLVALTLESVRAESGVPYFIYSYFNEIVSVLPVEDQIGSSTIDNLTESSAPMMTAFSTICDFVFLTFIKNSLRIKNVEHFEKLFGVLLSYKTHQNSHMRELVTRHLHSLFYFCPFLLISERIWDLLRIGVHHSSTLFDYLIAFGVEKTAFPTNNSDKLVSSELLPFKDSLIAALRINFPGYIHLFAKRGALDDYNKTVLPLPAPDFFVVLGVYKSLNKSFDDFIEEENISAATIHLLKNLELGFDEEKTLIRQIRTLTSYSSVNYAFAIVNKTLRPLFLIALLEKIASDSNDISILAFTQQLMNWVTSSVELINNPDTAFIIYQQIDETFRAALSNCTDFEIFLCWSKLSLNFCAYLNYLERFLEDQGIINHQIERIMSIEQSLRSYSYVRIVHFIGTFNLFEVIPDPEHTVDALRGLYQALSDDDPSFWRDNDAQTEALRSILSLILHRIHYRISAMALQFMTSPPYLAHLGLRLPSVLILGQPKHKSFRLPALSSAPKLVLNSISKQVYLDSLSFVADISPDLLVRLPLYFNVHEEISTLSRHFLNNEISEHPEKFVNNPKAIYALLHATKINPELVATWAPDTLPCVFKFLSLPEKGKYKSLFDYACRIIGNAKTSELIKYLPQLSLLLLHCGVDSQLFQTISHKAENSPIFLIDLLWSLTSEKPENNEIFDKILDRVPQHIKDIYNLEKRFVENMTEISGKLLPIQRNDRKAELDRLLEVFANKHKFTYEFLPVSPQYLITELIPSGVPLKSHAKVPLLLNFKVLEFESIEDVEDFIMHPDKKKLASLKKSEKSCIFKLGDDVRQDFLALQLIEEVNEQIVKFREKSTSDDVGLWLKSYKILPTNPSDGVIEVLLAQSRDQIGQQVDGSLIDYFVSKYGSSGSKTFDIARNNFISSMSCYSIMTYILQVKDRHNGNIMIDDDGHIIHIDFGFIFDISPGRNAGVENAPFKLTRDMFNTIGGSKSSPGFESFVNGIFYCYLLARESIIPMKTLVSIMQQSDLPCYKKNTIRNFVSRFKIDLDEYELWDQVNHMVNVSLNNMRTNIYDRMQHLQNQIEF